MSLCIRLSLRAQYQIKFKKDFDLALRHKKKIQIYKNVIKCFVFI